jgi:hypothetical protein
MSLSTFDAYMNDPIPEGKTLIYGRSDDTVLCDGYVDEEFEAIDSTPDNPVRLTFSSGAVTIISFGDGIWRIAAISHTDHVDMIHVAPDNDERDESDAAYVDGAIIKVTFDGRTLYRNGHHVQ